MKTCSKCGLDKPKTEFYIRSMKNSRLHAQCKKCYQEHRLSFYAEHYKKYRESYLKRARLRREQLRKEFRSQMLNYMSDKKCGDCGEADIRVLELDHVEPQTKKFTISQAVRLGKKWQEVERELEKCRVLCANCHKKRTAKQFNWYKA